jgi:DNA-binding CsgD family transcriptional regulator
MGQLSRLAARPETSPAAISLRPSRSHRDDDALTRLIGHIYDAALDSTLWVGVLERIGEFVGGRAGGIVTKDSVTKAGTPHHCFGVDPHYVQLYADTHSRFDPVATLPLFDVEQILSVPELMPYEEFCDGRFFHEWMRPQGLVDCANSVLEKSALSCSFLTIIRDEASGVVDDDMRLRMEQIVPHVRRAVLIGKAAEHKAAQAATFVDVLDGLNAGMFLIAADGRIVHANTAGDAMLSAGDCLRSTSGRLVARDSQADKILRGTLAAAAGGDIAIGVKGIALPLSTHDGEHYVAHVLPLTSETRRLAGVAGAATSAVFVRKAALNSRSAPDVIARAYELTPTELRVLLAIVEVGGIPEVAAALGVAASTIRTHVGRLLAKTGTGRQADLVKLVAGYCTPLAV